MVPKGVPKVWMRFWCKFSWKFRQNWRYIIYNFPDIHLALSGQLSWVALLISYRIMQGGYLRTLVRDACVTRHFSWVLAMRFFECVWRCHSLKFQSANKPNKLRQSTRTSAGVSRKSGKKDRREVSKLFGAVPKKLRTFLSALSIPSFLTG